MKMVWTKSNNPMDWLILLITGEDCAHFALVFKSSGCEVVFETNLLGAHPSFYNTWAKTHNIIHEKEVPLTHDQERELWVKWVNQFDGTPYDFLGVLYVGLMTLRQRWFGIPKPATNRWRNPNCFYCDEIYQLVSGLPGFPAIEAQANGMDSPHEVWENIQL